MMQMIMSFINEEIRKLQKTNTFLHYKSQWEILSISKRINGTISYRNFQGEWSYQFQLSNTKQCWVFCISFLREFDWHRKILDQSIINFDINKHQIKTNNHTSVFCLCRCNAHSDPTWHAQTTWSDPHAVLAICQTYFTTLKIYFSRTISNYF